MKMHHRPYRVKANYPVALLLLTLLLAACNGSSRSTTANNFDVQLTAAPEGRSGTYLTVKLTDRETKPVTDAKVGLEGDMTHAGMAPIVTDAVADGDNGEVDGVYQIPFAFSMAGDWLVTVVIERNGSQERHEIKANVNEKDVVIEGTSAANDVQVAASAAENHRTADHAVSEATTV